MPKPTKSQYRDIAIAKHAGDDLEIHPDAPVSITEPDADAGAWVQAWIWIPEPEKD